MTAGTQTPPSAAREREIFLEALALGSPGEREAFLAKACGGDTQLRSAIEQLLLEEARAGSFLETPALGGIRPASARPSGPGGTAVLPVGEGLGDRIDRYKLLQEIGVGGCGVVYMAEQQEPVRRRVALKVIKLGMDTRSVIARFEAERQALAMMDHPNIARVLDAGTTTQGRPYFVMELVRGIRITDYCQQHKVPTRERLQLFTQVCNAIQHAHQKGIIHRDIKPSNILVTLHDGVPVPKVIDFGIAKAIEQRLTDKTLFTEFKSLIGTPAYMSPEQAEMSGLDVDTRADIYALGVLLYELLTGGTPFDPDRLLQSGLDEMRRVIREEEPPRPSTRLSTLAMGEASRVTGGHGGNLPSLIQTVRGDLDWIVMKCLDKDRTRRYPTANDLVMDIQRYLNHEPVLARPPSTLYRFQKFSRRHRGTIAAAAAVTTTLLAGIIISGWMAWRATQAERAAYASEQEQIALREDADRERRRALEKEALSRLNEYVADMNLAQQAIAAGNYGRAIQLLEKHRTPASGADLRGFEWRYLWNLSQGDPHARLTKQEENIQALAISPDGTRIAAGLPEEIQIWDAASRAVVATLPRPNGSMQLSFAGERLISAGFGGVKMWDARSWKEEEPPVNRGAMFIASGSNLLLAQSREAIHFWDLKTASETRMVEGFSGPSALSPDGTRLIAARQGELWSIALEGDSAPVRLESAEVRGFSRRGRSGMAGVFAPDGSRFYSTAAGSAEEGFQITAWDAVTGRRLASFPEQPDAAHTSTIAALAIFPDGRTLATGSYDHSIRLWDLETFRHIDTLHGHRNEVWALAVSPDGRTVISGGKNGEVNLWPYPQPAEESLPEGWPIGFSADGNSLALHHVEFPAGGWFAAMPGSGPFVRPEPLTGYISIVNMAGREQEERIPVEGARFPFGSPLAMSQDLRFIATPADHQVKVVDRQTGDIESVELGTAPVLSVALSGDGRYLLASGRDGRLWWCDLPARERILAAEDIQDFVLSKSGSIAAVTFKDDSIRFWDSARREFGAEIPAASNPGYAGAFSPDGRTFATITQRDNVEHAIKLWDAATGALIGNCTGHKQPVNSVDFSPDGLTLASTGADDTLKLWNTATRQEVLSFQGLGNSRRKVLFSPSGTALVVGGMRGGEGSGARILSAPFPR